MQITDVHTLYFSPTGTTRSTVEAVASGLGLGVAREWDLTLPGADVPDFEAMRGALVVIGAPVYAGRVPATAVERLRAMGARNGDGAGPIPCVLVATYGNRHYDDALVELEDVARELGFVPVAAGAFIGEHSFSSAAMPVAAGRPDIQDLDAGTTFGVQIKKKIEQLDGMDAVADLGIPGSRPYKCEGWNRPPMAPAHDEELCETCGTCAEVCPVGAISLSPGVTTDAKKCIMCAACTRACIMGARTMDVPFIQGANKRLYENCSARREPELFL